MVSAVSSLLSRSAWLGPAAFIVIWASGYITAKYAAPHADALTFLLWRYGLIVVLMLVLALAANAVWPSRKDMAHLALAGVAIHAGYLAGVWVSIKQGLPSGVAALIVNLQPVLTAALAVFVGERLNARQWLGVGLGFAGVSVVVTQRSGFDISGVSSLGSGPVWLCIMALLAMTLGTLYQKHYVPKFDLRAGQAVQFVASFLVTLPFALWLEPGRFDWNVQSSLALAWSVLGLTGLGITLMFWMLRHGLATKVTSTMYLVPSVTALMAWVLFSEMLTPLAVGGMLLSLVGVWLVVKQ